MKIIGNGHEREIDYATPEWSNEEEACFTYRGDTYFLSEFIAVDSMWASLPKDSTLRFFDAYMTDTFFSGIGIKLVDNGESVKVYTFYS